MNDILVVDQLKKQFGAFTAVDGISFRVGKGEIVGLLGPNGAGKTTTIFMLLDLIAPTSGDITLFGLHYKTHHEQILQRLNYSSTYVEMVPRLTVWENLLIMAKLYQVPHPKTKIKNLIGRFGVQEFLTKRHEQLSQGQKTRVHLCKAFLNDPEILLLDEPTASLDPDVAAMVRAEILTAQKQGMTILFTSHNMAEVEEVCERVLFINHGKIVAEDTPMELAKKVRQARVHFMMKDGQKRTMEFAKKSGFIATADGRFVTISIDESDIAFLLAGLGELGVEYREISIDKPTLEDYFIKMTVKEAV
jgi:ABC-2 type transport system ATP-binding protein